MAPLEHRRPCLSGRSLPPSLWYLCRLSAWYLLPLQSWSHTPHIPSLPLSPTYLLLVPISISHFQIHTACTCNWHRRTDALGTPTHILKQTIYAGREEQKLEGCFSHSPTYQCLSRAVIWAWCMSPPWLSEGPLILTGLLLYVHIAHSQKNSDRAVCADQHFRFVCFGHITVWIFLRWCPHLLIKPPQFILRFWPTVVCFKKGR